MTDFSIWVDPSVSWHTELLRAFRLIFLRALVELQQKTCGSTLFWAILTETQCLKCTKTSIFSTYDRFQHLGWAISILTRRAALSIPTAFPKSPDRIATENMCFDTFLSNIDWGTVPTGNKKADLYLIWQISAYVFTHQYVETQSCSEHSDCLD